MKPRDDLDLLADLASAVADWQRSASAGRGTKTAEAKARKAAARLLTRMGLEGKGDVGAGAYYVLRGVGEV